MSSTCCAKPCHGPRRQRLPGAVHGPRPGWQVPRVVRRHPRRGGHRRRAQRCPHAENELNHGTVGADLPPRATGPDVDLEPAAPTPRPTRVRTVLQRTPPTPGHRERTPAVPVAHTDHRPGQDRPSTYKDAIALAASSTSTSVLPDLHGRSFRQEQSVASRAATATPPPRAAPHPSARAPRDRTALAPRPDRRTSRPHLPLQRAAALRAVPTPITDPNRIAHLNIRRNDRLGGTNTNTLPENCTDAIFRQSHGRRTCHRSPGECRQNRAASASIGVNRCTEW